MGVLAVRTKFHFSLTGIGYQEQLRVRYFLSESTFDFVYACKMKIAKFNALEVQISVHYCTDRVRRKVLVVVGEEEYVHVWFKCKFNTCVASFYQNDFFFRIFSSSSYRAYLYKMFLKFKFFRRQAKKKNHVVCSSSG